MIGVEVPGGDLVSQIVVAAEQLANKQIASVNPSRSALCMTSV